MKKTTTAKRPTSTTLEFISPSDGLSWRCSWWSNGTLDFFLRKESKEAKSWRFVPRTRVPPAVIAAGRQRMMSHDQVRRARGFSLMGAFARWYMDQPCRPDRDNVEFRLITSDWALAV